MRDELIKSATLFLKDPQVADATLAKKVQFLESKGLTNEEVEEALKIFNFENSNNNSPAPFTRPPLSSTPVPLSTFSIQPPTTLPPPIPERGWKDYFIMATVSSGVFYGLYEISTRYILPLICPPDPVSLQEDKKVLETEFARAEALLDQLHKDTQEIKESELHRKEHFTTVLSEAQDAIETIRGQSLHIEIEMHGVIAELDKIKEHIPQAIEKNRDQQDKALLSVQKELISLKQIIDSRMKTAITLTGPPPASSVPSFIGITSNIQPKPSISTLSMKSGPTEEQSTVTSESVTKSIPRQMPEATSEAVLQSISPSSTIPPPLPVVGSVQTLPQVPSASSPKSAIPAWQLAATKSESAST